MTDGFLLAIVANMLLDSVQNGGAIWPPKVSTESAAKSVSLNPQSLKATLA